MYDIEQQPLLWVYELFTRLLVLFTLQIGAGIWALFVSRWERISGMNVDEMRGRGVVYGILLSGLMILQVAAYNTFDARTHVVGAVVAGLSMGFVTPLEAVALVHRERECRRRRKVALAEMVAGKTKVEGEAGLGTDGANEKKRSVEAKAKASSGLALEPVSAWEAVVQVAVPATRSPPRPPERASLQAVRGALLLAAGGACRPLLPLAIAHGGLALDILAAFVVYAGAWGSLSVTSAMRALLVGRASGESFRGPFLSPSMASFWGGRWNAPVSDALREGIAIPLRRRGVPRSAAVLACFAISGVAHEGILRFAGIVDSRGEWAAFFLLAGLATAAESRFASLRRVPLARRAVAVPTLAGLFHYFFVPVAVRTGLAKAGLDGLAAGYIFAGAVLRRAIFSAAS